MKLVDLATGSDWIVWIVFVIFAVFSIILLSGHGSWFISGYNTASKEEKEKNGNQDSDNDFNSSSADNTLISFQHDNAGESNDNKSDGENISKVSPPLSRVVM